MRTKSHLHNFLHCQIFFCNCKLHQIEYLLLCNWIRKSLIKCSDNNRSHFFVITNSTRKCTLILLSSSEHKTKIQNIWDICAFTAVVKALVLSGAQCAFTTLISLIYFISKMCQLCIFKYFAFYLWQTFESFR